MQQQECHLDELGYYFVKKCIETIETRGLDDQGLYRIGGVNSRVTRLLQMCLDRKNYNKTTGQVTMPDFSDPVEWETKTITSALKNYLRNLSEPLMTYNLHPSIIEAAKIENLETRTNRIKSLIQQLPIRNFTLLKILVEHLRKVAINSQKNLMTVSNLGICFAPTLMRGPDESSLSIMEIKYSNVVANTLIEDYDSIFNDPRLTNPQQSYNPNYTPAISNNHDHQYGSQNQFGLALPSQSYQNHFVDEPVSNSLNYVGYLGSQYGSINSYPWSSSHPNSLDYSSTTSINNGNQLNLFPYYTIQPNKMPYRSNRVITLYACVADTESELSFGPNEIINDGKCSSLSLSLSMFCIISLCLP